MQELYRINALSSRVKDSYVFYTESKELFDFIKNSPYDEILWDNFNKSDTTLEMLDMEGYEPDHGEAQCDILEKLAMVKVKFPFIMLGECEFYNL